MTMKTKRIASLLLSAALLLSLAVPAFAENPTTEETARCPRRAQEPVSGGGASGTYPEN